MTTIEVKCSCYDSLHRLLRDGRFQITEITDIPTYSQYITQILPADSAKFNAALRYVAENDQVDSLIMKLRDGTSLRFDRARHLKAKTATPLCVWNVCHSIKCTATMRDMCLHDADRMQRFCDVNASSNVSGLLLFVYCLSTTDMIGSKENTMDLLTDGERDEIEKRVIKIPRLDVNYTKCETKCETSPKSFFWF